MIRIIWEYYIIKKSGFFDLDYYLSNNSDVMRSGINPLMHFIKAGWKENRNPCEYFNTEFYLTSNQDVEKAGINPLVHYIRNGRKEGRATDQEGSISYSKKSSKAEKIFFLFKELSRNPVLLKKFFNSFLTKGYKSTKEKMFFYYVSNKSNYEQESSFMDQNYFGLESLDFKFKEIDNKPFSSINLKKFDYFLFDVFDTALIRLFFRPEDVFKYISYKKNEKEFASKRVDQEISARKRKPLQKDIRLTDIYEGLEDSYNIKDEIEAENRFCVANPQVLRFYSDLIEAGKKIYFISDMYLDKKTISGLLEKNGYNIYEDIFVSSEDDLIKGDGSRYEWLKIHFPDISGRAVMIGDNIISDYEQPKAFGYDSFHYLDNESFYRLDPFLNSGINFLKSNESLGLSMIFSVFRYWKLSFNDNYPLYWRQFGFLYGGALVCSFCKYVHDYVFENNPSCKKVFFMGRDGDIMNKVFRILFDKSDIECAHILASRRSFVFPALTDLSTKNDKIELLNFIRPQNVKGTKTILERIGYFDLSDLEKDLNSIGKDSLFWSSDDIHYCLKKNRNSIIEKSENERKILFDYLMENNFFEYKDIIIADIGWGGSIQAALTKLLKIWDVEETALTGIYFGVNTSAFEKKNMKGFLFDKDLTTQIFYEKYINLMELLCSSPMDPIDKFENKEGNIVPVSSNDNILEKKRQLVSSSIQEGITEFADLVKKFDIDLSIIKSTDFMNLFKFFSDRPSPADLRHLYQLKHSAGIGDKHDIPVVCLGVNPKDIVKSDIKVISVFINEKMYNTFFTDNYHVNCYELIGIDNRKLNLGLSTHYNQIIEEYINEDCWLFFCHEDFRIMDSLNILDTLDKNNIYGTFGVKNNLDFVPVGYGKHICSNKDGSNPMEVGLEIENPVKVDSLDCQSVAVHTSLLRNHCDLRFDENLTFDLYVEDFCINAQENFNIEINVFPLKFQHFSYGNVTERYFNTLNYLAKKFPEAAVPGSCSFIGGKAHTLEKFFKYENLPCYK